MSNLRHVEDPEAREKARGDRRVHPLVFVVVLLLGVAAVLWFVATHSSGGGPVNAQPATQPLPASGPAQ